MKSYRRKASDRLGDKLNDQLKKDLRANMSEAELFSFARSEERRVGKEC